MAERRKPRRRRRWIVVAVVVVAVVVLVGVAGVVLGPPARPGDSGRITATVQRGDVVRAVTASGSLVDEYTYTVAAGTVPVLSELAGVATGSTGGSSGSSAAPSSGSTGYTTRSVAVSVGAKVAKNAEIAVARDSDGDDHTVKTPVAGHVRRLSTAVGASASSVAVIGAGRVLAAIDVNENAIGEVERGQAVRISVGQATTTGAVQQIAQLPDGTSGVERYRVLVVPASIPSGARIGRTITATIDIERHEDVLTVPAAAVSSAGGRDVVQVLGERDAVRTVRVRVGLVGDSRVEITGGLRAGQRVVLGDSGSVPASTGPRAPGT